MNLSPSRYGKLTCAAKRREFVHYFDAQKPEYWMHRALSGMDASGHPAEIVETALEYILRKCYASVSRKSSALSIKSELFSSLSAHITCCFAFENKKKIKSIAAINVIDTDMSDLLRLNQSIFVDKSRY